MAMTTRGFDRPQVPVRRFGLLGRAVVAILCFATLAALVLASSSFAQKPPLETVRVIGLNRPFSALAAQSQGFLAKHGIAVEFMVVATSDILRRDLADGKADVAYTAADNAVAMADVAGVDVVILMGGESSMNELIVQPSIKTVADLRGRKVLVDAPNTAYALQLRKVLLLHGMQPGKDFEMKSVGSTPFRLKAMQGDPSNAAAIMNPPFSLIAKHSGLVSMGSMKALLGADQDRATFAVRSWATKNANLVERYLAAYVEGQRWMMAPANRPQVIALVMQETSINRQLAEEWYAAMIQSGGFAKDARFNVDGFRKNLQLRAEVEGNGQAPAAEKYFDLSYYEKALSKLNYSSARTPK